MASTPGFINFDDEYHDEALIEELHRYGKKEGWAIKALYYKWYMNWDFDPPMQGYMPYVIFGNRKISRRKRKRHVNKGK